MNWRTLTLASLAISLNSACTTPGTSDEVPAPAPIIDEGAEARRCISLSQISNVRVIGDRSIEFKMYGGKNYINILPHKCPGLRPGRPFMYRTSLNKLCDMDLITLLDTGGYGMRPLASCGLGRFEPLIVGGEAIPGEDE